MVGGEDLVVVPRGNNTRMNEQHADGFNKDDSIELN